MLKKKIPESFDSEYYIYEKLYSCDSEKESYNESNVSENINDIEYIEELNNNYSFIKNKLKAECIKNNTQKCNKTNIKQTDKIELKEEQYLSD